MINKKFTNTGRISEEGSEDMSGFAIGAKIKALRIKNGLTQEELANRSELSKGFISQLESEQTSPSIATLVDILECLGTNLSAFFNDATDEKVVFTPEDYFVKDSEEEGHSVTWVIPNCQKNDMEPILLDLLPGGTSPVDEPHSGEEFGYVLGGSIRVHVGEGVYKAKKGESFYFTADKVHYLENVGKTPAKVLWVATPPSF